MEALHDVGAAGLHDPVGQQLPPCIIMDKGESLQEMLELSEPDRYTSLSVRAPPVFSIQKMHRRWANMSSSTACGTFSNDWTIE